MLCVVTMTNVDFILNKVKEIKFYLTQRKNTKIYLWCIGTQDTS